MSKPLRFTIFKMQRGGKILYRIRIPARFAASGKKTDLYYKTRVEAEEEQALLREKFANGELTLGTVREMALNKIFVVQDNRHGTLQKIHLLLPCVQDALLTTHIIHRGI